MNGLENATPFGLVEFMIKKYPNEGVLELMSLFESVDKGDGVVIKKLKDKEIREALKILFKKCGLKKTKFNGEKVYLKKSDAAISLVEILKHVAKL
jgi:bifunctional DNA-binding transcriptional regulator/antitoxin component of YhaV-PrlF toxin-antitoxin module